MDETSSANGRALLLHRFNIARVIPKLKKERMLSKWNVLMSLPCKVPSSHRSTDDELFTSDDKLTSPNEPD